MRTSIDFGMVLHAPEKVGTREEELRKLCAENPKQFRFASVVSEFWKSVEDFDMLRSCYWLVEAKNQGDKIILNSLCDEFIRTYSKVKKKTGWAQFLAIASFFCQSWEKGDFEDCLYYLSRIISMDVNEVTHILYCSCADKLASFKERGWFLNHRNDRVYLALQRKEDYIDFFEEWEK